MGSGISRQLFFEILPYIQTSVVAILLITIVTPIVHSEARKNISSFVVTGGFFIGVIVFCQSVAMKQMSLLDAANDDFFIELVFAFIFIVGTVTLVTLAITVLAKK